MSAPGWKLVHHGIQRHGPEEVFPTIKERNVDDLNDVLDFLQTVEVATCWYFGVDLTSLRNTWSAPKTRLMIVNFPVTTAPQFFVDLMGRIFGANRLSFTDKISRVWLVRRSMNPQVHIEVEAVERETLIHEIVEFCQAFQRTRMDDYNENRFSVQVISGSNGLAIRDGADNMTVKNTLDSMKRCISKRTQ